jgi:hypothetical protein
MSDAELSRCRHTYTESKKTHRQDKRIWDKGRERKETGRHARG